MLEFITKLAVATVVGKDTLVEKYNEKKVDIISAIESAKENIQNQLEEEVIKYIAMYPEIWVDSKPEDYRKLIFKSKVQEAKEGKKVTKSTSKFDEVDMSIDAIKARIAARNKK